MVRAKFKLLRFETSMMTAWKDGKPAGEQEFRTLFFTPVYGNGDPNHENTRYWNATPSGEVRLGTVNKLAWERFELGAEYYLDFSLASAAPMVKPTDD